MSRAEYIPGADEAHEEPQPDAGQRPGGKGKLRASRPYDERPFVWASRAALEKIQRHAGIGADYRTATCVYLALCRLASERGNAAELQVQTKVIASLVGLRYRQTWATLKVLEEECRVIRIVPQTGKTEGAIYELLSFPSQPSAEGPMQPSARVGMQSTAKDPCNGNERFIADSPKRIRNRNERKDIAAVAAAGSGPGSLKREFTDRWCKRYQEVTGRRYLFQDVKDGKAADKLLKSGLSIDKIMTIAEAAWEKPDGFNSKQAASLAGFASRFNEIQSELTTLDPNEARRIRELYGMKLNNRNAYTTTPVEDLGKLAEEKSRRWAEKYEREKQDRARPRRQGESLNAI